MFVSSACSPAERVKIANAERTRHDGVYSTDPEQPLQTRKGLSHYRIVLAAPLRVSLMRQSKGARDESISTAIRNRIAAIPAECIYSMETLGRLVSPNLVMPMSLRLFVYAKDHLRHTSRFNDKLDWRSNDAMYKEKLAALLEATLLVPELDQRASSRPITAAVVDPMWTLATVPV